MLELRSAEACALPENDRLEAAANFTKVMYDLFGGDLRDEYGRIFTCTEAEAAAKLFRAFGYEGTAETILASHKMMDCNEHPLPHEPGNY
ncbi:hypothetical protein N7U49_21320 [Streptomyces sp. AD2-2]|nr:hypothetical protein N7U49_21320 [Streptomyces sp. AD2-2]